MSSSGSTATFSSRPERVGRHGALRLRFARQRGETVLAGCRYTVPLQVLAPVALEGPAAVVSILNPTGGLVGGDRLAIDVVAEPGVHAVLTTPSATKVYRTEDAQAIQDVTLRLGRGATIEYVPDHTIPFPGSAFCQSVAAEIGEGARLLLVDAFAAGRVGRGEAWRFDRLESGLGVRDEAGWLLRDRFRLRGDPAWAGLGLTEGAAYFATIVGLGEPGWPTVGEDVAALTAGCADVEAAGGVLARRGWLIRCLAGTAPALTETVERLWSAARRQMLGLGPLALRK
ncbi:MAG TPA: urease accessory protein UreD [Methylomirabilota bacterium]|jgi:urease accessory protein|nr:urease accessory protein UreD [Methylomirabilota bacterium]